MRYKSKATRKIARNAFQGVFFLASCLLLPASSSAQSPVNVTATVKDSAGIPYSNATVSILLIPTGTAPTVGGAQISGTNNGQLDVNGKLNVSLYKNTDIVPASSQWQFTICETPGVAPPLGTGGQCFTSSQTVSAAVDFSTQFQAAAKALTAISIGGGAVTSVGATAPITSTGGATPTIACATCISGLIANTQVAYGTGPNAVGNDGNIIWDATVADPPRKQLTVQGSQGVLRPYNYTNAVNSTWSIDFSGHQANAATALFGDIQQTVISNTNGAVSGQFDIHTMNAGVSVDALKITKEGNVTAAGSLSTGAGAGACGAVITGCNAYVGGAISCTPTAGQACQRYDSVTMKFLCTLDVGAEGACASSALSALTAAAASNTIANGNNPQTWNWAQTTDSQDGIALGETSAATGGTLTNGFANQAVVAVSTLTNSTASPLEITQGPITNTVATPLLDLETTWNNGGLVAKGILLNVTNTASSGDSELLEMRYSQTPVFAVSINGLAQMSGVGSPTLAGAPSPLAQNSNGWKYCLAQRVCTGVDGTNTGNPGIEEFHFVGGGLAANSWLSLSNVGNGATEGNTTTPNTNAGAALGTSGGLVLKENACSTNFTNDAGRALVCPDSTLHEYAGYLNGSTSAGLMVRAQPGGGAAGCTTVGCHFTGQTGTKNIYTLCPAAAGACNTAGQYRITWYFNQNGTPCGTPAPGQVTFEVSWTDNAGAHSAIALPMNDNSSIAVFTSAFKFAATNVTGFASGEFNLWSTGAQPIQVTNTYTGCAVGTGTWELTAAAERVK